MIITLYKSKSEPYRADKTSFLSDSIEYSGTLRDTCSVINPTFTIESYDDLSQYNYCYIPDFHRYYYISSIDVVQNGLWAFTCHVDVLMTYNKDFRKLNAIVARQSNKNNCNLYLTDDKLLIECDRDVMSLAFGNSNKPTGSKTFVLTVAGG